MWINKFIAHTGFCSRREADKLVEEGRVFVNGEVATKTLHVTEADIVKIDDKHIPPPKRNRIYIALNKPIGIVCTTETNIPDNIIEFVGHEERIFPIGRMDRESSGLIFLTNDGDIVNRFTEEEYGVEKEYFVRVDQKITYDFIQKLLHEGIPLEGKVVKAIRVVKTGPKALKITILQDMRRQIRRMCSYCGFRVFKCERIRIMHIHVRDIPTGDWRYLTRQEVMKMFHALNYNPSHKWLLPGETPEKDEEFDREVLAAEQPRQDFRPVYRDESRQNARPYDNRGGGGGGYRQENRGGGGGGYNQNRPGGYNQNRFQQPYDNRNQDNRYPPRDDNRNAPYDNRNQDNRYPPRDNRYPPRDDNRNAPYDNRDNRYPPRDNRYPPRDDNRNAPYENRDNRYPPRDDNRNAPYDNRGNDNRYPPRDTPPRPPREDDPNFDNRNTNRGPGGDDRFQSRYANRYDNRGNDNRYPPRDDNRNAPYDNRGNDNRYPPRDNRYDNRGNDNRYPPRDNAYERREGPPNNEEPEGNNYDRTETPRPENRRPLWRAKPDEPAKEDSQD